MMPSMGGERTEGGGGRRGRGGSGNSTKKQTYMRVKRTEASIYPSQLYVEQSSQTLLLRLVRLKKAQNGSFAACLPTPPSQSRSSNNANFFLSEKNQKTRTIFEPALTMVLHGAKASSKAEMVFGPTSRPIHSSGI